MSPAHAVASWWHRWKITVAFVAIFGVALFSYWLVQREASHRVESVCASLTQVKDAALSLSKPASTQGVTDPSTLARIDAANQQRLEAKRQLVKGLACRK